MKKKTPSVARQLAALNEDVMPETLDEDGSGMGGGEAPGGAMGGAVAGASGSCPGCEGAGEVHAGDCQHAEQNNLPREGFGYVIAPEHKKHHHHHVEANEITSVDMSKDHLNNAQKPDAGFEDVSQSLEEGMGINDDSLLDRGFKKDNSGNWHSTWDTENGEVNIIIHQLPNGQWGLSVAGGPIEKIRNFQHMAAILRDVDGPRPDRHLDNPGQFNEPVDHGELDEKAKLGSGARFKDVEKSAAASGADNPAAVAAAAGIKKYGVKGMEKMAHAHESSNPSNPDINDQGMSPVEEGMGINDDSLLDRGFKKDNSGNWHSTWDTENGEVNIIIHQLPNGQWGLSVAGGPIEKIRNFQHMAAILRDVDGPRPDRHLDNPGQFNEPVDHGELEEGTGEEIKVGDLVNHPEAPGKYFTVVKMYRVGHVPIVDIQDQDGNLHPDIPLKELTLDPDQGEGSGNPEEGQIDPNNPPYDYNREKWGTTVREPHSWDEQEKPLEEGKYLQSGLSTREAAIPFTQDPTLEGVPDYLNDEEKASVGLKSQTGMPAESGSSMEESMSTTSIMDQFKKGDIVNIDRVRNVEWIVESVQINPDQITVKSGKRKKTISPKVSFIEHVDGAEVHKERQFESIENLREEYLKMTIAENPRGLKADWCTYEESAKPEVVEDKRPVLEKNEIYRIIKDRGLQYLSEGKVYQELCEEMGNPIAEIQRVMEDAGLSGSNADIDNNYRYNTSAFEENEFGLVNTLENAWKDMEAKEIEETAKLNDEQPGNNGGGLGVKQLKGFNL